MTKEISPEYNIQGRSKRKEYSEAEDGEEKKVRADAEEGLRDLFKEYRSEFITEEEIKGAEKLIKLYGNQAVEHFRLERESGAVKLEVAPEEFKEIEQSHKEILEVVDDIPSILALADKSPKIHYKELVQEVFKNQLTKIKRDQIKILLREIQSIIKDKKTVHPMLVKHYGREAFIKDKDVDDFRNNFREIIHLTVFDLDPSLLVV